MQKEYITVISSILTGVIGYSIREWQNHSKPFISLLGYTGDYIFSEAEIELDENVINSLNETFYLSKLNLLSDLENIKETRDTCQFIKDDSAIIIQICDEIQNNIRNKNNSLLFQSLKKLFDIERIDAYFLGLLLHGLIKFPNLQNNEDIFRVTESSINGGAFIISYTGKPFSLGAHFDNDKYYKDLFTPLAKVISTVDIEGITNFSDSLKNHIRQELIIANTILPKLENIVDDYSHWGCELYVGNLKKTPILINNEATLFIEDKTGAMFSEKCILVLSEFDEEDNETRRKCHSPLIIPSGDNISFSFFTQNSQKLMDRGQDFRNAFNQGEAKGYLEITLRGVGLIKERIVKTKKVLFSEINIT